MIYATKLVVFVMQPWGLTGHPDTVLARGTRPKHLGAPLSSQSLQPRPSEGGSGGSRVQEIWGQMWAPAGELGR